MTEMKQAGVYAFIEDQEIVYIGMSTRPAEIRIKEHYNTDLEVIKKKLRDGGIYQRSLDFHARLKEEAMEVIILYSAQKGDTKYILEEIEFMFIELMRPKYNSAGVICEYFFSEKDEPLDWEALQIYGNDNCSWETARHRARKKKEYGF